MLIDTLTDRELLSLYVNVLGTLRARGTTRSSNNPVADYAEGLCAKALNLTLANKSTTGYDGTDPAGNKIEIKARRITKENGSRQLSAIRGIEKRHFDYLAGVLFNADFSVMKACLIPYVAIRQYGKNSEHTNSHRFLLRDSIWSLTGVRDITKELQEAEGRDLSAGNRIERTQNHATANTKETSRGPILPFGSAD
jgi:hypothetical protein